MLGFSGIWRKAFRYWRQRGGLNLLVKIFYYLRRRIHERACLGSLLSSETTLQIQRESSNLDSPVISLIVPVYNTSIPFLIELFESVVNQTNRNWQLCLADGSDDHCLGRENMLRDRSAADPRIKYQRLPTNLGISGNSNVCLDMADGLYLALLDHDDCLAPDALYEVNRTISEQNADFIYTDELCFSGKIRRLKSIHLKPDFSLDNLRSNNYICHLTVFSRHLLNRIGEGFRSDYDGSQDYDLILRLTEKANKIVHIPRVLYFWRVHPGSVSADLSVKPYCLAAARAALTDHLKRCQIQGQVVDSMEISTYRIIYELSKKPLISILLNMTDAQQASEVIIKLRENTDYPALEFVSSADIKKGGLPSNLNGTANRPEHHLAMAAKGVYFVFINPDLIPESPDWLDELLRCCQRQDTGAVGALLLTQNHRIHSAGLVLGLKHPISHAWRYDSEYYAGYMSRLTYTHNTSAVSLDCLMVSRELYMQTGGIGKYRNTDAAAVDFCLQLRRLRPWIIVNPYARLRYARKISLAIHENDKVDTDDTCKLFERWPLIMGERDPYYHPVFNQDRADFQCEKNRKKQLR